MPQPGGGQVEGFAKRTARRAWPSGDVPNQAGPPSDLAHDAFQEIVGAYPAPVLVGKTIVDQGLVHRLLEPLGDLPELHGLELGGDLAGPGLGRLTAWIALSMRETSRSLVVGT